jgi:HPt (histidine-containing phosphotransfer) domain-containing protein
MSLDTNQMLQKLGAMQALFTARLPVRLAAIDAALQDCRDQPGAREPVEELHRVLHSLTGAAGTFGYDALGLEARSFESDVQAWLTAGSWSERDLDRLALQLPRLQAHLQQTPLEIGSRPMPDKSA